MNAGVPNHVSSFEAISSGRKWGKASPEQWLWKMGTVIHGSLVITSPLVNIFGEVEGGVQPLHLSPTQVLREAEAGEHILCVFMWVTSGVQGFCFAKRPFLAW